MLLFLLLMFTVVPATELYLLIQVGRLLGTWDTILLVLLTGITGAYLARAQGHAVMLSLQKQLSRGEVPADTALQGILIFLGGVLLVTPGFVTDIFGLAMVLPGTRHLFVTAFKYYLKKKIRSGQVRFYTNMNVKQDSRESSESFNNHWRNVTPPPAKDEKPADVIDLQKKRSSRKNSDQDPQQ